MKKAACSGRITIALTLVILLTTPLLAVSGHIFVDHRRSPQKGDLQELETTVRRIVEIYDKTKEYSKLEILHPYNQAIFPFDIASLTIRWKDKKTKPSAWLIIIDSGTSNRSVFVLTDRPEWRPDRQTWETIKNLSLENRTEITILGISGEDTLHIVSKNKVDIMTSKDRVRDPVFYIQAPLPFVFARDNPEKIRWRLGDLSSYDEPDTILEDMPSCGNCHSLNDFRVGKRPKSFGLFPKISPDGKYEVSSINVKALLVTMDALHFSEFLYHASGIIGYYSETDAQFHPLPGAENPEFIQTHPAWSPNGKDIVFARARVDKTILESMKTGVVLKGKKDDTTEKWNKKYPVKYDIYRIPFNNGKGGTPEMIKGAAQNGMSNFFPRYSPDGKWIVFTQAKHGFVIQPSSRLFIIPAEGGTALKMNCNTDFYNSYHSWSSNSRWLVFTSKKNTPYTELFLAHVDENGKDSPPVLLERFNSRGYAAIVPEFIRKKAPGHQN